MSAEWCGLAGGGEPFALLDGAYVLGALDPGERAEFEAHLATCAACRARVAEVGPVADLLADVRAAGLDPLAGPGAPADAGAPAQPVPPPDTLLPGLLRRARRDRSRRRVLMGGLGLVAAACAAALVVVVAWPSSSPSGPAPRAMSAVAPSPVHATAKLVAKSWGTEIELACRYDYGAGKAAAYTLRVVGKDGRPHAAGSWSIGPGSTINYAGGTALAPTDIAEIDIARPDGTPILRLRT